MTDPIVYVNHSAPFLSLPFFLLSFFCSSCCCCCCCCSLTCGYSACIHCVIALSLSAAFPLLLRKFSVPHLFSIPSSTLLPSFHAVHPQKKRIHIFLTTLAPSR
ncbi:hypothetical protein JOL62DRAFT_76265 [Phyllosticta paracitricarpa]|uniref:Uncharacterized protein n=1 Tax=Phyllosticta paracitricarpa TaxID=2016321 RepID=A0ABR1N7Z5_9PEZI